MATIEHCLYCFEALASHLEDRKPMTLAEVQDSWAEYLEALESEGETSAADGKASSNKLTKRHPALRRLAGSSSSSSASSSSSSGSSSPASSSTSSTLSLQQQSDSGRSGASTPATSMSSLPATAPPASQDQLITESPLFVTWNILSPRHGYTLRGCIGTFEAQDLDTGLSAYALESALHDMRFSPISTRDLPSLEVAVTLLTDFEDAADAMDWDIGVHGLRLSFNYKERRYGSTYLPDVASEQGWSKEKTVEMLMMKAGWTGKKDTWRNVKLKVVRYQGKRESCEWAEYKAWREWVEKNGKKKKEAEEEEEEEEEEEK